MKYPDRILRKVVNPMQYLGGEYNMTVKDPEGKVRICMSFPDLYTIGMSSYGHMLMHHLFNGFHDFYAERVYAVMKDMEAELRTENMSILSLETGTPVREFDMLGFTVEYELTFTNILQILDLSKIPFRSEERGENDPIVVAGGTAVFNPLPIKDFIDVFFVGDGEGMTDDIAEILRKRKWGEIGRNEALQLFDELEYTYVPLMSGAEKDVKQKIIESLGDYSFDSPMVPNVKVVHDRVVSEIARGCTRGCRFCQAGIVYRPVRERSVDNLVSNALKLLKNTGYGDISLLSLSATDYTQIGPLLKSMTREASKMKASVSLPSLRIGEIDSDLYSQISSVRKSGVTIAVETGSERLRKIINKDISTEEIYSTIRTGRNFGWRHFKLYFMAGLPFETDRDIEETRDLINDLAETFRDIVFNVSVSPFVPRPFTPFQWSRQIGTEELRRRIGIIRGGMKRRNADVSYREPDVSFLEGVFARGDGKLCRVVEKAYMLGSRFDEWSEHFSMENWRAAAEECGVDLEGYLREYTLEESLPWDFIQSAVTKSFLEKEFLSAENGSMTPDCRTSKCTLCGACGGEIAGTKRSAVKYEDRDDSGFVKRKNRKVISSTSKRMHLLLLYSLDRDFQYLSHLGMINLISTGLRRSGIDFAYTQGFNPRIKAVYGPPKPVSVYSRCEALELFIESKPDGDILQRINSAFPEGVHFYYMKELQGEKASLIGRVNRVKLSFLFNVKEENRSAAAAFLGADEFFSERDSAGGMEKVNIRRFVESVEFTENSAKAAVNLLKEGSIKFEELYRKVLGIDALGDTSVFREGLYVFEDNIEKRIEEL